MNRTLITQVTLAVAVSVGLASLHGCQQQPAPTSQAATPKPAPAKQDPAERLADRVAQMDDRTRDARSRASAATEVKQNAVDEETRARAEQIEADMLETIRLASVGKQWMYERDSDAMTSAETVSAMVMSTNTHELGFPYSGAQHAALMLRRHPTHGTDVIFTIERGQILCRTYGDCPVRVRFDDQEPRMLRGNPPADHSSTHVFIPGYKDFVTRLGKAKRLLVEVDLYQEGAPVWEFDVEGFKPAEMN